MAPVQDAFVALDEAGVITDWEPTATALFGLTRQEALGRTLALIVPERCSAACDAEIQGVLRSSTGERWRQRRVEVTARRADGPEFPVELTISMTQGKVPVCFDVFLRDVSEQRGRETALAEAQKRLSKSEEQLALALESGCDGVWEWRAVDDQLWFSDRLPALLGYVHGEVEITASTWASHIHPDDAPASQHRFREHLQGRTPAYQDEYRLRRKDGSHAWILARGKVVERNEHGCPLRVIGTVIDVSERKRSEARITYLARHDALTDLPNRVLFGEAIEQRLATCSSQGERIVLFWADLDGFKAVNDGLGHHAGDAVLAEVAKRLRAAVRREDVVARLGGDEFAVLQVVADADPASAATLAQRLIDTVAGPMRVGSRVVSNVGLSIGVIVADGGQLDADALLRCADIALYDAKAAGRNTYRFYDAAMHTAVEAKRGLEADLRQALERSEFELHYQPLVQAASGRASGAEALLRWRHPTHGLLGPADFIPLAENAGLSGAIGAWVLRAACLEAASWPERMRVAVNMSADQFCRVGLVATVGDALSTAGLKPQRLELEITESILMRDGSEVVDTLHRIRDLGVRIALDDFGTGYSSLNYLRRFPFDRLKIDRSFVQDLATPGTARIVRAMIDLGRGLGMRVTAEGVETDTQRTVMCDEGCEEMQGYLFSKPLDARSLKKLIFGDDVTQAA